MARSLRSTKKVPKFKPRVQRRDSWENSINGFGVLGRDKRLGSTFTVQLVTQDGAEDIWQGDDIAARIIETIPNEMLREGFEVCVSEKDQPSVMEKGPPQLLGKGAPKDPLKDPAKDPSTTDPASKDPKSKFPASRKDAYGQLPIQDDPKAPADSTTDPAQDPYQDPNADPQDPNSKPGDSKDLSEEMASEMRRLDAVERFRDALQYERAYGGAGIFLGVDDGVSNLEIPLDEKKVKAVSFLNVLTPKELQPFRYYSDPRKPRYGEIAVYRLVPIDAPPDAQIEMPLVHESRIIRFGGIVTSRGSILRNFIPGWGQSIFPRVMQVINDFQASWQGAGMILVDFSPPVLKIKGLAKVLASKGATETSLAVRAKAIDIARSIARTTIIDAEEEFERKTVPVTGLAELLDKMMLRLAAAAGMPVSLLMGQAPAGLNATGDSDIRWFYDQISAMQEKKLRPGLMRLAKLLFLAKEGPAKGEEPDNWDLKFSPLWQLTDLEEAELRNKQAQTDEIYITAQVVTPQEIAKSRFGGDAYSTETQIDHQLRDEMASADDEMTKLGAGAAQDKAKEQEAAKIAAEKGPAAGGGFPGAKPASKKPAFPPK